MFENTQFVARMGFERIMLGQGLGDFGCEFKRQAPRHIDIAQFFEFSFGEGGQFLGFTLHIGGFAIGLRTDRNIFPRRHGH